MTAVQRFIPVAAGLAFLGVAGFFAVKGSYMVAGIFVFGAFMFLRPLLSRPD